MKIEDFVDNFCGPDRNAFQTVLDREINNMGDLFIQMRKLANDLNLKVSQPAGTPASVDLFEAAELFCDRVYENIHELNDRVNEDIQNS